MSKSLQIYNTIYLYSLNKQMFFFIKKKHQRSEMKLLQCLRSFRLCFNCKVFTDFQIKKKIQYITFFNTCCGDWSQSGASNTRVDAEYSIKKENMFLKSRKYGKPTLLEHQVGATKFPLVTTFCFSGRFWYLTMKSLDINLFY